MIQMVSNSKSASECSDCGLCPNGHCGDALDPIVQEVVRRVRGQAGTEIPIPVGVSARHAHVSQEALEILFGKGHELTPYRELYQPGAYAAEELLSIVGPRLRAIERVRILGPCRDYNQVELARTDAIFLGVDPPMRDSGDLRGASQVTFIGPNGSVTAQAAIRAARHIHLRPADVAELGLLGREAIRVRVGGEKGLVYENVRLKVDASYLPEIHLDTDDANAADLTCGNTAYILK
ncbi:MAG: phosphate propanoyltransferase [bacterium]|nr:phosphate propanoyltransferase [bacterium]